MASQQTTNKPPSSLRQIKRDRQLLEQQIALKKATRELRVLESIDSWLGNDWWARSDPVARCGDVPRSNISITSDRRGGDNWPIFRTEQEHARFRQDSRICVQTNGYAQGVLENLCNYIVGKGFNYKAGPKSRVDTNPDAPGIQDAESIKSLVAKVQKVIDRFCAANDWNTGTAYCEAAGTTVAAETREQEAFKRTRRDGELFVRYFADEGQLKVRFVEPEAIKNPPGGLRQEGWTYGIRHKVWEDDSGWHEDVETIEEYYVASLENDTEGEFVPADQMLHFKVNVDRNIKRGLPDFIHSTLASLTRAQLLQRNLSESSIAQAAVSEIQQVENATKSQMTDYAAGKMDYQVERPNENGSRTVNFERREPASVRYVPKGLTFVPPPWSNGTPSHQAVLQGDLRGAGAKFCAPEYLMSADASNANFASTKEAGTPFTKNGECKQETYKGAFLKPVHRAVKVAIEAGELPANTFELIEVQVEAPHVTTTDKLAQAQVDQIYVSLGSTDRQTVCMKNGGEWETVQANNLEYQDRFGQQGQPLQMPGTEKPAPGVGNPFAGLEALLECGGAGGKPGPCPDPGTDEHNAIASKIVTDQGFLEKLKKLPKAAVSKVGGFVSNLYAKAEQKYGPRWAKAIVATAIITLPTPITTPAVLAMTGLAHIWTKLHKTSQTEAVSEELELTAEQVQDLAKQLLADIEAGMMA